MVNWRGVSSLLGSAEQPTLGATALQPHPDQASARAEPKPRYADLPRVERYVDDLERAVGRFVLSTYDPRSSHVGYTTPVEKITEAAQQGAKILRDIESRTRGFVAATYQLNAGILALVRAADPYTKSPGQVREPLEALKVALEGLKSDKVVFGSQAQQQLDALIQGVDDVLTGALQERFDVGVRDYVMQTLQARGEHAHLAFHHVNAWIERVAASPQPIVTTALSQTIDACTTLIGIVDPMVCPLTNMERGLQVAMEKLPLPDAQKAAITVAQKKVRAAAIAEVERYVLFGTTLTASGQASAVIGQLRRVNELGDTRLLEKVAAQGPGIAARLVEEAIADDNNSRFADYADKLLELRLALPKATGDEVEAIVRTSRLPSIAAKRTGQLQDACDPSRLAATEALVRQRNTVLASQARHEREEHRGYHNDVRPQTWEARVIAETARDPHARSIDAAWRERQPHEAANRASHAASILNHHNASLGWLCAMVDVTLSPASTYAHRADAAFETMDRIRRGD